MASLSLSQPNFQATKYEKQAKLLIGVWILFLATCLVAGGGRFLILLYPAGSLALGLFLYSRTPHLYVAFTLWMLFLGGLIRRMIDYQSGYITPGRWGLTTALVMSIGGVRLLREIPRLYKQGALPFLLSLAAIFYAFLVGILLGHRDVQYVAGIFDYCAPVLFGLHLYLNWRHYLSYRRIIEDTFILGIIFVSLYAIFQYFIAPGWDAFYMDKISALSFGVAEPFKIRVFSTFGSPQACAVFLMSALLLLFASQSRLKFFSSASGYLAFLLTMARSGWLGWVAGVCTFFPFLKPRYKIGFVGTLLVMSLLTLPLTKMEPFADPIQERLESISLSEPDEDVSFSGRKEAYEANLGKALRQFPGMGLGNTGPPSALGGGDSGIFPLLFSFGWVGAVPYVGGISLILSKICSNSSRKEQQDTFSSASRAIVFAVLAQVWFNNIFSDTFAVILWIFLGISLASRRYYLNQSLYQANLSTSSSIHAE